MKLLLITHLLPYPPHHGCSLRNLNLIKQCSEDHEIDLITFYRQAHVHPEHTIKDSIELMKNYCREVKVFRIPSDHSRLRYYGLLLANLFSSQPYSATLYQSREMVNAIRWQLSENNYDVIEIGEIGLLNYAQLAPDTPKVLVHHNVESQLLYRRSAVAGNVLSKYYLSLQAYKLALWERRAGQEIAYHTTCSEQDKNTLLKISPQAKIVVVPNGVDTQYFKPTEETVIPNSLVFVGGLNWMPNHHAMQFLMAEIWPILKKEIPDLQMFVVGGNPPQDLVDFSKQNTDFKLTGLLDDIRPLVSRSAVYVVPIRVGGGTRLKIMDAMAMGKAIVSHSVGCEGIGVTDDHDILIGNTAEEFSRLTIELLRDEEKRKTLGRNARQTAVEKYDWTNIAPSLSKIYNDLGQL